MSEVAVKRGRGRPRKEKAKQKDTDDIDYQPPRLITSKAVKRTGAQNEAEGDNSHRMLTRGAFKRAVMNTGQEEDKPSVNELPDFWQVKPVTVVLEVFDLEPLDNESMSPEHIVLDLEQEDDETVHRVKVEEVSFGTEEDLDVEEINSVILEHAEPQAEAVNWSQALKFVFQHLDFKSLLECRQVSQDWRVATNAYLESDGSSKTLKSYTFSDKLTITRFLTAAKSFGSNPFLGRSAKFTVTSSGQSFGGQAVDTGPGPVNNYWTYAEKLMYRYGQHLWHLTIHQEELCFSPYCLYQILSKCLSRLPNLKTLQLNGNYDPTYWSRKEEVVAQLKRLMAKHPLALVPNLTSLQFEFESQAVLRALIEVAPNLTSLITNTKFNPKFNLSQVNLKQLELLKIADWENVSAVLPFLNSGLEQLTCSFSSSIVKEPFPESSGYGIDEVVVVLPALKKLSLKLVCSHYCEEWRSASCHLDQKQILQYFLQNEVIAERLLLEFPNLEVLQFTKVCWANKAVLDEVGGAGLVYGSDIWGKLTRLQKISLGLKIKSDGLATGSKVSCQQKVCWTRDKYLRYQAKKKGRSGF